jgi:hypothetical protein
VLRLVYPWRGSGRGVVGDSYFASVELAEALLVLFSLYFVGVVKNSSTRFPMELLNKTILKGQGDSRTMVRKGADGKQYTATVWTDRTRRTFISTQHRSTSGPPCERGRWRNDNDGVAWNLFTIPQPELVSEYYKYAGVVDRHNRRRQDDLGLERKLEVKEWSLRLSTTILGMIFTDAFLLYKGSRASPEAVLPMKTFIRYLAGEMILNNISDTGVGSSSLRSASARVSTDSAEVAQTLKKAPPPRLIPTTDTVKNGNSSRLKRKNCCECSIRVVTSVCSLCKGCYICDDKDYTCMMSHIESKHPDFYNRL